MQTASANFEEAANAKSGRVLAPTVVYADWDQAGVSTLDTMDGYELFERQFEGSWGPKWQQIEGNLPALSVAGGIGIITKTNTDSFLQIMPGALSREYGIKARFGVSQLATGAAIRQWLMVKVIDVNNWIGVRLDYNIDQVIGYGVVKCVAGTQSNVAGGSGLMPASAGLNHTTASRYWLKAQYTEPLVGGWSVTVKVWQDGFTEPAAWLGTAARDTPFYGILAPYGTRASVLASNTNGYPIVYVMDGFSNGEWDNLSEQIDDGWAVTHALNDGMPPDVSDQTNDAFGTLSLALRGRDGRYNQGSPESAARYFSQFYPSSPVSSYDRDVAPMTLDAGLVTKTGLETVRMFTGQMTDIATDTKDAALDAVSATNRKLQALIQPPGIIGDDAGLTSSWPVSYALAMSGLYVSPPPRSGCIWWAPMHGSLQPFIDGGKPSNQLLECLAQAAGGAIKQPRQTFTGGPFLDSAWAFTHTDLKFQANIQGMSYRYGSQILSKAGNAGRIEFWIRTDVVDVATPPGGAGSISYLAGWEMLQNPGVLHKITAGVDKTYKPFITVNDGTNTRTFTHPTALPIDGGWHFVGCAYDMTANALWLQSDSNVLQSNTPSPAMVTTNLPATDVMNLAFPQVYPAFVAHVPVAEVQVTSGPQANAVTNGTWINDPTYFTAASSKVVMRSGRNVNLQALAEPQEIRAIDLIEKFAAAELAMTRCDELDRYNYLTLAYWVETGPQTQVETYQSTKNILAMQARRDITRIRNSVQVGYKSVGVTGLTNIFNDAVVRYIPPGKTTLFTIPLSVPAVSVDSNQFQLMNATTIDVLPLIGFLSLNTNKDGSGIVWTNPTVPTRIVAWDPGSVTIAITSNNSGDLWTVRADGGPGLGIAGRAMISTDAVTSARDAASIAARGERGLSASLEAIQDADWASIIANELVSRLARPRWRVDGIELVGDHRRQPGDLVRVTDAENTALDGLGRVMSIVSQQQGASFVQTATVVQAWQTLIWDQGRWDNNLWGL